MIYYAHCAACLVLEIVVSSMKRGEQRSLRRVADGEGRFGRLTSTVFPFRGFKFPALISVVLLTSVRPRRSYRRYP